MKTKNQKLYNLKRLPKLFLDSLLFLVLYLLVESAHCKNKYVRFVIQIKYSTFAPL